MKGMKGKAPKGKGPTKSTTARHKHTIAGPPQMLGMDMAGAEKAIGSLLRRTRKLPRGRL